VNENKKEREVVDPCADDKEKESAKRDECYKRYYNPGWVAVFIALAGGAPR